MRKWEADRELSSKKIQTVADPSTKIETIYYNEPYGLVFNTKDGKTRYVKNDSITAI